MQREVAIIGCGAIGKELAVFIDKKKVPNCILSSLFDLDKDNLNDLSKVLNQKPVIFSDFDEFVNSPIFKKVNLVIEAASIQAARKYCPVILDRGKDLLIMSIGAFSDPFFYNEVSEKVKNHARQIFLPSGAIGGLDIIRSIKNQIKEVILVTTKNNKSLKGAPFFDKRNLDVDAIKEKKIIYEGTANDAIKEFPSNVNVAALLSIAGSGFESTRVLVILDPKIQNNKHEINIKWEYGEVNLTLINRPSPTNPKTSYLAILSALECLKNICNSNLKIGS